jgi:hypothetical protein
MSEDSRLDDDTSAARVTQGGRGRRGHSIWWALLVIAVAAGVLVFALSLHQTAPTEQGTTPVPGSAPAPQGAASAPSSGAAHP